jgi:hypothetical protein
MGSAIFVPFELKVFFVKKQTNTTFVWFSDYYLNIPLWGPQFSNFIILRKQRLKLFAFSIPTWHLD